MSTLANTSPQETKAMTQRPARRRRIGKILGPYFFLLPASLFLLLFLVYPVVNMIIYSFEQVNVGSLLTGITPFVGLDNYRTVISDPSFRSSLVVSLIFTIASLVFQYILGFAMALLFNRRIPLVGLMRGSVMIAWMLPVIVSATIFKWMLQRDSGIVNYVLQSFHVISTPIDWLTNPQLALVAVIGANIWIGIPFNMSLLLAGLQGISGTLYEAAVVDGANAMRRFLHITLPLMRSTSLTILMLGFIYTLNVFDLIYVLTGGGPVNATEAMPLYAYRIAFGQFDLGSGAAVATLMFLLLLGISAIYLFLLRREEVA
ncbi:carbohydrate ABC transporter permease [Ktedonospora formicarum]|uniref:Sugar ABC transporter permease n=1 Tax=Ktedonospora formicarum TaxID=2778364 RepID=A0A8J3IEK0_9CHLR|nr:sugar ABC transporter permease [Ktedonospora formicarum]GHO50928.1 sugar ABC transporter permease [Ktedonospora formicarum]